MAASGDKVGMKMAALKDDVGTNTVASADKALPTRSWERLTLPTVSMKAWRAARAPLFKVFANSGMPAKTARNCSLVMMLSGSMLCASNGQVSRATFALRSEGGQFGYTI